MMKLFYDKTRSDTKIIELFKILESDQSDQQRKCDSLKKCSNLIEIIAVATRLGRRGGWG